ncbi:hypothetical protein M407DRAFT_244812 [Tulasnella calospora MUT 4182]|uniref:Uncharacterized protein n=1 Tax=Tulasnella calospora MUT 4182 TaxID=1051891 RepID=A0A0C3LPN2_9AGAM|nr:hypothetical protein M407DRAFT_244812 [Tulasnella calospora MUT 4182]
MTMPSGPPQRKLPLFRATRRKTSSTTPSSRSTEETSEPASYVGFQFQSLGSTAKKKPAFIALAPTSLRHLTHIVDSFHVAAYPASSNDHRPKVCSCLCDDDAIGPSIPSQSNLSHSPSPKPTTQRRRS